jgi:hypothetical protein
MVTSLVASGRPRQDFFTAGLVSRAVDVHFCSGTSKEVGSILAA